MSFKKIIRNLIIRGDGLMGYLFCKKCGGYYELSEGESLNDFAHCSCGGSLIYTEHFEGLKPSPNNFDALKESDYSDKSGKYNNSEKNHDVSNEKKDTLNHEVNNSEVPISDFEDEKNEEHPNDKIKKVSSVNGGKNTSKQLSTFGLILMLVGLLLLIFAFFYPFLFIGSTINNPEYILVLLVQTVWIYLISIIMMILGAFIFLFFNIAMSNSKKRSKVSVIGENLKGLPGSYTIFSNVKIPKTRSQIGRVVIGSNGIFIIQTRIGKEKFIISDDEWWRLKSGKRIKAVSNPGKIVKMNSIDIKRFLNSHNVNVEYMWITPIVTFPDDQFTIEKEPKNYNLMPPENVLAFILNQKRTMPPELMMRAIALMARHSN